MSNWMRLTKTDNRAVEVNLVHAQIVLRDERNYATTISFGASDTITVLETPDQIFGRTAEARRSGTADGNRRDLTGQKR